MDLSKYRQLFISETQEMLEALSRTLVTLERNPKSAESVNTAFRHFHSIKGMSGTMGFSLIFELAHQLEELMARVRDGRLALGPAIVDLLLEGVDQFGGWINAIDGGAEILAPATRLHHRIGELLTATSPPPAADPAGHASLMSRPGDLLVRAELIEPAEISIRGYLLVRRLGQLGSVIDTVPSLDQLRSGRGSDQVQIALRGADPDRVRGFLEALPDWATVSIQQTVIQPPTPADDDDDFDFDDLAFTGGFGSIELTVPEERVTRPAAIVRPPPPPRSIRVRTAWVDQLLSRIAALQQSAAAIDDPALHRHLTALERQADIVRRAPMSVLTDRLPRVVRDLARQAGKKADLVIEGGDEQLDRGIIEGIDAALTHLVRNAVAHGIEAPAQREAANKTEAGQITLRTEHNRDAVIIELSDDGAGLDAEELARRAAELGLLDPERAQWIAEHDPIQLLRLPGFTTRTVAGEGAGRGIGLDAAAADIEALGGRIAMRTRAEHGTTFEIRVPLIRGVTGLLLLRVAGRIFAVQRAWVRHQVTARAVERVDTVIRAEDEDWPLRIIPGVSPRFGGMVVLFDNPRGALEVDEIMGEPDLLVQPLPAPLDLLPGIAGAVQLPSGEPVLVLAVHGLAVP